MHSGDHGYVQIPEKVKVRTRGILFDMDGVLISSLGSVERSWQRWGEMRGIDGSLAIKTAHGMRAIDTIRRLRPDLDDAAELRVIENIEIEDREGLELLRGVLPLLAAVPRDRWTIVTSATERLARVRLEHAGVPAPQRFITADMVQRGKPDPEPYLRGAELLGLRPEDCLVIEDATSGTKAGKAAGCKVLATLFSHSPRDLAAADWLVDSLEDVQGRLEGDWIELEFQPARRS